MWRVNQMIIPLYQKDNTAKKQMMINISLHKEEEFPFADYYSNLVTEKVIIGNDYYASMWIITNQQDKVTINFDSIKYTPKGLEENYEEFLKRFLLGRIRQERYAITEARYIKRFIEIGNKTKGFEVLNNIKLNKGEYYALEEFIEETNLNINIDLFGTEEEKSGGQRELAEGCHTYYVIDKELKSFWENASEEEKIIYFPLYMFWIVCNVIPTRPVEFCITQRNCVYKKGTQYYLRLKKTPNKGSQQKRINNVDKYPELVVPILSDLGEEILWYIFKTNNIHPKESNRLFTNDSYNLLLGRNVDSLFKVINLAGLKDSFNKKLVDEKNYQMVFEENGVTSYQQDEWISNWCLGDLRHLAISHLIRDVGDVSLAMIYAAHSNISTTCGYYNIKEFENNMINKFSEEQKEKEIIYGQHLEEGLPKINGGFCTNNLGLDNDICALYPTDCSGCRFHIKERGVVKEKTKKEETEEKYNHMVKLVFKQEIEEAREIMRELGYI